MNDSWEKLNGETVEREVNNAYKVLYKNAKVRSTGKGGGDSFESQLGPREGTSGQHRGLLPRAEGFGCKGFGEGLAPLLSM